MKTTPNRKIAVIKLYPKVWTVADSFGGRFGLYFSSKKEAQAYADSLGK